MQVNKSGVAAMGVREGDRLAFAALASPSDSLLLTASRHEPQGVPKGGGPAPQLALALGGQPPSPPPPPRRHTHTIAPPPPAAA